MVWLFPVEMIRKQTGGRMLVLGDCNRSGVRAQRWVQRAQQRCTHTGSQGRVTGGDQQFSAFPCVFALHPPRPLLPQGKKGEFRRPETQNQKRNAESSQKPTLVSLYGAAGARHGLGDGHSLTGVLLRLTRQVREPPVPAHNR